MIQYSGGQAGNAVAYLQYVWGINGYSDSRTYVNGVVNYQLAFDPALITTLSPSGDGTINFRVSVSNLNNVYGSPTTCRVCAVQL